MKEDLIFCWNILDVLVTEDELQSSIMSVLMVYLISHSDLGLGCRSSCKILKIDWCLTPTLAIFQLYRGVNTFYVTVDT